MKVLTEDVGTNCKSYRREKKSIFGRLQSSEHKFRNHRQLQPRSDYSDSVRYCQIGRQCLFNRSLDCVTFPVVMRRDDRRVSHHSLPLSIDTFVRRIGVDLNVLISAMVICISSSTC